MIVVITIVSMVVLLAGYGFYGRRFLSRRFRMDDSRPTPAHEVNDGVDFVPAKASLLLGQHFSAIAAAGPIVGPILAGLWFGWLPALLWIVLGAVFIGGVHDFTSLFASIRHKAASIGEIVRLNMSRASHLLFLFFVWFTLVYVISAFTDITAQTFKAVSQGEAYGPGVAASSIMYLGLALVMGIVLARFRMPVKWATLVFVPLVLVIVWVGPRLPAGLLSSLEGVGAKQWDVFLLAYCFVASIIPVWLLLQPRGYLGGWLLYLTLATGLMGALFGGYAVQYPAFNLEGLKSALNAKPMLPLLFITVACGACSGFHGIVSSGTTSKQLAKESDALPIGYGAMLLESLVAVLALATVMMLAKDDPMLKSDPNLIYASGLAKYLGMVGIGFRVAFPFALLAFSTFVYDTLDVSTRLARYILQEILGFRSRAGAVVATAVTIIPPLAFLMLTQEKGYLVAWPIFGTSNQLLASLTLLAISVWLVRRGKKAWFVIIPMIFMMVMAEWSLYLQVKPLVLRAAGALDTPLKKDQLISGICGMILVVLSVWLIIEALRSLVLERRREGDAKNPTHTNKEALA